MFEIFLVMLCGLTSRVETKDADNKGRFNSPVLDVTERQIILEKNQMLQLNCRGRWELEWVFPSGVSKSHPSARVVDTRCGRRANQYCSRLTLSPALAQHTGTYRCRYSRKQRKHTSVYIFITDSQQPFVKVPKEIPDVVYMKEGQDLVFPCRVTNPYTNVSLVKFPNRRLGTDNKNIIWNNRKGFVIRSPTYFYIGLFFCETIINGTKYTNKFLTYRPVNKIQKVYLNSTGLVQALRGERLALNCTVTAEWNSRVNINWNYPGKANSMVSISRRITQSKTNVVFYSILTVHKLLKEDKGVYTCHVTSGPAKREVNTSVIVYDQPFIKLKYRNGSLLQANAGQKSFRLSPKLRAFPKPEVIWMKDGVVAAEQCSRYHVDGYSLVIRDVAEEDAGVYTILTRIQQYGLHQNLTLSLVVNVKPQIGEKAVAVRDTATMPRSSRQVLRCTAHGIPSPQIQWLWHRCPSKGLCEELVSSSWTPVRERTAVTSMYNPVLSVTHTQEVLQGKNKTIGILTVGKALISGIYRCVASNSLGTDELDIRFYVTDVQGGFSVSGDSEEGPREGRDYHLSCVANKHLYSNMSWHRVTGNSAGMMDGPPLVGELMEGEYSLTLRLTLTNLTAQDSGMYRCSATKLVTGQHSHQDTLVTVAVLEAPVLLQNLSDCSVNISNSVTLQCHASGVPRPLITWYKDRRKLKQVSGIMLVPEDGTLHIDRITVEDEGLYTCQATNERGSAESSAYISVENSESFSLEIPTLACTCVVATLFWLLLTLLIRKLRQPNSTNGKTEYLPIILHQGEGPLDEHCDRLQYDAEKWEFPQERLQLEKPLGRGAFGRVMQASAFGISNSTCCTTVAVKMLKEGATPSEHKALMTELKILNHIGHHLNVVNLLGACTKPGGPLMVIVEYCKYGNLSSYLRSKRDVFMLTRVKGEEERGHQDECKSCVESQNMQKVSSELEGERQEENEANNGSVSCMNMPLHLEDLISYSFQVARGMEFLASRKCIHRDLAARNILLSDNNVVKICDFGLARDLYKDPDYVRKGDARLPLKWMSPESIFDKVFTTQSDVWSYGVLLWEIFSLGASPYPGLNIDEEFCHRLKQGTRMRAPEYSTPEIYTTMLECWERNPSDRPTFTELVGTLGDLLQARVQQNGKDYIPLNTFLPGESGAEHLDYRDMHQGSPSYINTRIDTIATFEENLNREGPEDSQSDSGMVLPSEEFIQLKWTDKFKTKKITRFFLKSQHQERMLPCVSSVPCGQEENNTAVPCGSPPPDYNTALLCSTLLFNTHS
ncbi:vascular endothelial growth factor receptor 1 isoform X1 [Neoarius graeffei]|uniref:vascular endothelial growth factor receptor 1 isoform X1 n=1 Tax=Neoarius graeffei TaxID=443677 RepID=UPI00298CCDFC|nr:vascular endothelial growth factor receptor 1 isoform X1 [Neoarius graeffei]